MQTYKATYNQGRVRLTERFPAEDLEQAKAIAQKKSSANSYRLVSVEEVPS